MFKNIRARVGYVWPTLIGGGALVVAILVATVGVGSSSADGTTTSQLAAADRSADNTANRGSGRTPATVSADPTSSTEESTTSTTDVPSTTTSTVASTTTTSAPITTTTMRPTRTTTTVVQPTSAHSQTGGASYYAQPWANKGCAHKTLPKGTKVTVTNLSTGQSAVCVVNDRGPYVAGRIIDLDTTIFKQLASTSQGVFTARISW